MHLDEVLVLLKEREEEKANQLTIFDVIEEKQNL